MMHFEIPAVVIDNGSYLCRAGLAEDDSPRSVFSSVVGRPIHQRATLESCFPQFYDNATGSTNNGMYVGDEVQKLRGAMSLNRPIERGVVKNWNDMEKIWHHACYNELKIDPSERPILLTESAAASKSDREKLVPRSAQILFESLNFPAIFLQPQNVLALYAAGRTTGVVINSGQGLTSTLALQDGFPVPDSSAMLQLGGSDRTNYLKTLRAESRQSVTDREMESARDMKEKLCFVISNPAESKITQPEKSYEMPDGRIIKVRDARHKVPEALFKPSLFSIAGTGIQDLVQQSIMKCGPEARKDLYQNIVLVGGNTMFPGLSERLENEMKKVQPGPDKVKVIASSERQNFPWIGGSILASLSTFQQLLVSKAQYDESGPGVIHRCP